MDESYAVCQTCFAMVLKDYYMDHMEWHENLNRRFGDVYETINNP